MINFYELKIGDKIASIHDKGKVGIVIHLHIVSYLHKEKSYNITSQDEKGTLCFSSCETADFHYLDRADSQDLEAPPADFDDTVYHPED
jgi:hypothetical protein